MRADPSKSTTRERIPDSALKYFTDREGFRDTFVRHINNTDPDQSQILVFHGVGGIGKTSLIRKLGQELDDAQVPFPHPHLPHARFDFENIESHVQAYREVLVRLRNELGKTFSIDFPSFDLCLSLMMAQEGGAAPKLVSVNQNLSNVYQFVLGLSPIPFTSSIATAGGLIAKKGAEHIPAFENWLRKAGGTEGVIELRKRARDDDQTLPDELIRRFASDLKEGLPKRPGYACRGVLFLDSYEGLWTGREASRSAQARKLDDWVRELAAYCLGSDVLLVITGRDRLRWDEDDPREWAGCLDQHLMGGISARDSQSFLFKCGIGVNVPIRATPLQNAIIHCCRESEEFDEPLSCHTLYLALCADIALNDRRDNGDDPSPEIFRDIPSNSVANVLADRFMLSLHDRAKEIWLEKLSLAPRFDQASATLLLGATSQIEAEAAWELLSGLSFAIAKPNGFLRLHDTMRTALRKRVTEDESREINKLLRDYWTEHGEPSLAFAHQWALDPYHTIDSWSKDHQAALAEQRIPDARRMLNLWADITLDDADRDILGDAAWAETHYRIGNALWATPIAPRASVLILAIAHFQAAFKVQTEADTAREWASTYNNMGNVYADLPTGDRRQNLQVAIDCFHMALRVRTEADFPQDWAATQNNLGTAFTYLPTGDRGEHLRTAITYYQAALRVYTEDAFPKQWAMTLNNLGAVYKNFPTGDRGQNLQMAIDYFETALRVYTESECPVDWAITQNNLGNAYFDLPIGDQGQNLQRGIGYYQAALRVYTEDAYPEQWAMTLNNLGNIYSDLLLGDRGQNLHTAANYYLKSLQVRTEADFPQQWASTQNNLGNVYCALPTGDRGQNLQMAIGYYQAALRVYTETDFPQPWAMTQNNLGATHTNLLTGDRRQNIQNAISCFQAALRVRTEAEYPQQWANTQYNLGELHLALGQETHDLDALVTADACYAAAERAYTVIGLSADAAETAEMRETVRTAIQQMTDANEMRSLEGASN